MTVRAVCGIGSKKHAKNKMTMKLIKKIAAFTFSLLVIIIFAENAASAGNKDRELVVLFTHDLHSHFLPHRILTKEGNQLQQG